MGKENKSYRIRTNVDKDSVVNFSVDNTVETLEILSLSINQANVYKLMGSNTGVIAGRVLANGGFGVPNVKVSVFIPYEDTDKMEQSILYHYLSTKDVNDDGIRYNLLPNELDDECHQNVGTFPGKRVLLDNNNWIDVFDKYYTFTTRTNESGDYMIYGVPTGMQTVHMDVDLSDIGILSQKPRDLIYKGYNANMFENMTKFKTDTNIDSLAQVITQNQSVYVYPFWGDTTDSELNASITRCDMNINYKFEPTCIFMGSVITDAGENAMSQKCVGAKKQGRMSDMITGEGKIEMIRKTANGQIEQFSVEGDTNINSDGVWCYQIPMNLDYVKTDEFGKLVMSDDPNTGLPTRARVRFRLSMAETPSDVTARKRARFLIPNNPHFIESDYPNFCETREIDYEFGTKTKDENFRDLFWNNVYTVKSYIPRLQKSKLPNNLRHLGIKMVNHSGANNPMPFNSLSIKFNFVYKFLCTLVKVLVTFVRVLNSVFSFIGYVFYYIGTLFFDIGKALNFDIAGVFDFEGVAKIFAEYDNHGIKDAANINQLTFLKWVYTDIQNNSEKAKGVAAWFMRLFLKIGCGIQLKGLCETDDGTEIIVTPGTYDKVKIVMQDAGIGTCQDRVDILYNCIENQLAQDNEVTSFNFYNDWINGVVYLPLWYRKIKVRRKGKVVKDKWCDTDNTFIYNRKYKKNLRLYATNVPRRNVTVPVNNSMGTIAPLPNNEDTVFSNANNETGAESLEFRVLNDENCYGYQCHKYSRTYFKVYKGLIYEKETMLGDRVYYYRPCDYDISTGNRDLVTLFATDLVLLGSLNECDIHGIPQFFKCLESTTYNMPPDLLSESYDYINEDNQTTVDEADNNEIDLGSRMTEYTGADWGNLGVDQSNTKSTVLTIFGTSYYADANENEYDNGGLFYGLTCFDSYTKPKSCINLSRICELGVSLDESQDVPTTELNASGTESDTDTLTPDGFVSYDEIYNPDYRSMFATLNSNFLRTKLNTETGMIEYDFNHMYLDNFDGSLRLLMLAHTVNGKTEKSDFQDSANYIGNYKLEQSSDAYLNFRYGNYVKKNGKKIYFYENTNIVGKSVVRNSSVQSAMIVSSNRLPRYENSFYFYFGLNEGKTAIDKFNNEFFSDCSNGFASDVPYDMKYQGNSWCPKDATDGFISLYVNVDLPVKIAFTDRDTNNVYFAENLNKDKIIFCNPENVPEGYEKYEVHSLIKKDADSIGGGTQTVPIIPNGRYTIELMDGNDNVYTDDLVFELPRISFACDVNPFNRKNVDLMVQFKETGDTLKQVYTKIANCGRFCDIQGGVLDRPIYGYVSISDVSEDNFRIELKPINSNFFGDNYVGEVIDVHINNGNVSVTYDKSGNYCGYLGYMTNSDGVTTYYFGVPYGGQRYRITITQLCEKEVNVWEESDNISILNVIVYEDEFKLYINGIDYDMISAFTTGWNDAKLDLTDGSFKDENDGASEYNVSDMYGWGADILDIGHYYHNGTATKLSPNGIAIHLDYTSSTVTINDILDICAALSSNYEYNGTGDTDTTPYHWDGDYCYDAPYDTYIRYGDDDVISADNTYYTKNGDKYISQTAVNDTPITQYIAYWPHTYIRRGTIYYTYENGEYIEHLHTSWVPLEVQTSNTYYHKEVNEYYYLNTKSYVNGTVQKVTYTYTIPYRFTIADGVILYDYYGDVIDENDMDFDQTYYTDDEQQHVASGAEYDPNTYTNYDYTWMNWLYDSNGIVKHYGDITKGETYYLDNHQIMPATINLDYIENSNYEEISIQRNDSQINLGEVEYHATYTYNDGGTITVATEDTYGNIEYTQQSNSNIEYAGLECLSFYEYRSIIDDINETITNRAEFSRTVAGLFRINDGETALVLTAKTKAKPVKYFIAGSSEITSVDDLYNYKPNGQVISVNDLNDLGGVENSGFKKIRIIGDGYLVDKFFETPNISFTIPTLTYGYTLQLANDKEDITISAGNKYYTRPRRGMGEQQYTENILTQRNLDDWQITGRNYVTPKEIYYHINSLGTGVIPFYNVYITTRDGKSFIPYPEDTVDIKHKHPYYVCVANDINSIIPPGNDLTNFDNNNVKDLTTTFGVHFYNKPLKGEFPMILSFINNIPAYPKVILGGDGKYAYLYNITQITNCIVQLEASTTTPLDLFDGVVIFYDSPNRNGFYRYVISGNEGMGITDISDFTHDILRLDYNANIYTITLTTQNHLQSGDELFENDVLLHYRDNPYSPTPQQSFYQKKVIRDYPDFGKLYVRDIFTNLNDVVYRIGNPDNNLLLKCVKNNDKYYLDDVIPTDTNWIAENINDDINYDNIYLPKNVDYNNLNPYSRNEVELVSVGNDYYYRYSNNSQIVLAGTVVYYNYNSINHSFGGSYTVNTTETVAEVINEMSQQQPPIVVTEIYHHYYSTDIIDMIDVTDNWKPVDVFMPGFMTGYLFNGLPVDSDASNIKAVLNEKDVKLYRYPSVSNNDVYTNINVKRLIYTDYTADQHPTYGTYRLISAQNKDYQYVEVPLADADLVYTDGYGDEYRYPVMGTLNIEIDNPILSYVNRGAKLSDDLYLNDDYITTRTFYKSDEGYTRHQSTYYIYDLEYTTYPLEFYKTNIPSADSNLKYDEDNSVFYFKEMPKMLTYINRGREDAYPSGYISKSQAIKFNVSEYLRNKYNQQPDDEDTAISEYIRYPRDKFFAIGYCAGYYTISPVFEIERPRVVCNYTDFNIKEGSPIYITAAHSRDCSTDDNARNGNHFIEDFYYLLHYRFTIHIATYDSVNSKYNSDIYSQVCSAIEGTAEKCYVEVRDSNDHTEMVYTPLDDTATCYAGQTYYYYNIDAGAYIKYVPPVDVSARYLRMIGYQMYTLQENSVSVTYKASALKIDLSALSSLFDDIYIPSWFNILIEDKSGIIRKAGVQTGNTDSGDNTVRITEITQAQFYE